VDPCRPRPSWARPAPLHNVPVRPRMGAGRAALAAPGQNGSAAPLGPSPGRRRRALRSARGLRLAFPARWAVRCAALRVPPWRTVYWWFRRLLANGTWDRLSAALVMADRERVGRAPQPTGCVLDSQTAKAGGTGVAGSRGGACSWAGKAGPEGSGQASRRAQAHGAGGHGRTPPPCGGRARRPAQHASRGRGAARFAPALALPRPVLDGCGLCRAAHAPMPRPCGSRWWALDHAHEALRSRNGDG
jgi:hypothetical protein